MMFLHFLKYPFKTGAVCSSSKGLAKMMIKEIEIGNACNIAEIGPGLGVFTQEILQAKHPQCHFFALEINKDFVQKLQRRFPHTEIYHQGAESILEILKHQKIDGLDVIVSGLPWSIFSSKNQDFLLQCIYDALKDRGYFSTFAYLFPTPQAQKFRKKLFKKFDSVKISKPVWKNFPPACVYYCQK